MLSWCSERYVLRKITYSFTNNFFFWWVCWKSRFIAIPNSWSIQLGIFSKNLNVLSKKREHLIIIIIFILEKDILSLKSDHLKYHPSSIESFSKSEKDISVLTFIVVCHYLELNPIVKRNIDNLISLVYYKSCKLWTGFQCCSYVSC